MFNLRDYLKKYLKHLIKNYFVNYNYKRYIPDNYLTVQVNKERAQGHFTRYNLQIKFFQTGFVVAWGGFLSYCKSQLIKFEEDKRFGL